MIFETPFYSEIPLFFLPQKNEPQYFSKTKKKFFFFEKVLLIVTKRLSLVSHKENRFPFRFYLTIWLIIGLFFQKKS